MNRIEHFESKRFVRTDSRKLPIRTKYFPAMVCLFTKILDSRERTKLQISEKSLITKEA